MKTIEKRITDLEASNVFRLNPLQVQIVHFGDGPLPADPPGNNAVTVSYVRYEGIVHEEP